MRNAFVPDFSRPTWSTPNGTGSRLNRTTGDHLDDLALATVVNILQGPRGVGAVLCSALELSKL